MLSRNMELFISLSFKVLVIIFSLRALKRGNRVIQLYIKISQFYPFFYNFMSFFRIFHWNESYVRINIWKYPCHVFFYILKFGFSFNNFTAIRRLCLQTSGSQSISYPLYIGNNELVVLLHMWYDHRPPWFNQFFIFLVLIIYEV